MATPNILSSSSVTRTRWTRGLAALAISAALIGVPTADAQVFCEENGLIAFQIESAPPTGDWSFQTNSTGYTGSGFYEWVGPNQFDTPGEGILTYTFNVTTAGKYNLRIRSRNNGPLANENNDIWTRINGSKWIKTVSHQNSVWSWSTRFLEVEGTPTYDANYFLNPGLHTFEISARSQGFRLDRVHLYLDTAADPQSIHHPESAVDACEIGTWTSEGFCAQDGLVAFQVESVAPAAGWSLQTNSTGYTGAGFFEWVGGNQFVTPDVGTLTYKFTVPESGLYHMRIRSRNNSTPEEWHLTNDVWSRIDGGPWIKTVSHVHSVWTWSTRFVLADETPSYPAYYNLSAGPHTLEISGRSQGFRIDRVHVYKDGTPDAEFFNHPQSPICVNTWTDLGNGLAGSNGLPTLTGTGDLTDGAETTISIGNGLAGGTANLVVGLSAINAAFKGGVIVPAPDVALLGLTLDGSGALDLGFDWPVGLSSGLEFYWQAWLNDAGGPKGFAATNGLRSTTP